MTRVLVTLVAMTILAAGGIIAIRPWQQVTAKASNTIHVEVIFKPNGENTEAGTRCGYLLPPLTSTEWPLGKQLIIRNETDAVIGTMDLADVFDLTQSVEQRPGVINDQGLCVVQADIEVLVSDFYTFIVEGHYTWTISHDALAEREWVMQVMFLS